MLDLTVDDFEKTIGQSRYVFILFSADNCPPCDALKETLERVIPDFPNILFLNFHKDQLGAERIRKEHLVGLPPRSIVFKDGVEVGRIFNNRTEDNLRNLLVELVSAGRILSTTDDAEEVSRFYHRVMTAMDIDWSKFKGEERSEKADSVMNTAHALMDISPEWSVWDKVFVKDLLDKQFL